MIKENLKDAWVEFTRYHCQSGTIDRWMGDVFDNPNSPTNCPVSANTIVTFYRLNGKDRWVESEKFMSDFFADLVTVGDEYDANEFWMVHLKDE